MQARRYGAGDLETRLSRWPERVALRDRDVLDAGRRMAHALAARLAQARQRADGLDRRLARRDVRRVLADRQARIAQAEARLRALAAARRHAAERRFGALAAGLQALSPLAVLGRGYALCWNDARTGIIRAASQVRKGDRVRVTLASGELGCRVEDNGTP
jgi:exodeoxyribonuclease VII large subunit